MTDGSNQLFDSSNINPGNEQLVIPGVDASGVDLSNSQLKYIIYIFEHFPVSYLQTFQYRIWNGLHYSNFATGYLNFNPSGFGDIMINGNVVPYSSSRYYIISDGDYGIDAAGQGINNNYSTNMTIQLLKNFSDVWIWIIGAGGGGAFDVNGGNTGGGGGGAELILTNTGNKPLGYTFYGGIGGKCNAATSGSDKRNPYYPNPGDFPSNGGTTWVGDTASSGGNLQGTRKEARGGENASGENPGENVSNGASKGAGFNNDYGEFSPRGSSDNKGRIFYKGTGFTPGAAFTNALGDFAGNANTGCWGSKNVDGTSIVDGSDVSIRWGGGGGAYRNNLNGEGGSQSFTNPVDGTRGGNGGESNKGGSFNGGIGGGGGGGGINGSSAAGQGGYGGMIIWCKP